MRHLFIFKNIYFVVNITSYIYSRYLSKYCGIIYIFVRTKLLVIVLHTQDLRDMYIECFHNKNLHSFSVLR